MPSVRLGSGRLLKNPGRPGPRAISGEGTARFAGLPGRGRPDQACVDRFRRAAPTCHDGAVDMRLRRATAIGVSTEPCGICGGGNVVAMRSRAVRRGAAWLDPRWDPAPRTHDLCRDCGAKHRTEDGRRV